MSMLLGARLLTSNQLNIVFNYGLFSMQPRSFFIRRRSRQLYNANTRSLRVNCSFCCIDSLPSNLWTFDALYRYSKVMNNMQANTGIMFPYMHTYGPYNVEPYLYLLLLDFRMEYYFSR